MKPKMIVGKQYCILCGGEYFEVGGNSFACSGNDVGGHLFRVHKV